MPKFLVGMFRNALKIALEEIVRTDDEVTQERGWKLLLMLTPTSRWGSDLQGEVTPTFPAIRGGSLDSTD